MLVEFGEIPSLLGVIRLEDELGELLGVRVHLVVTSALKPNSCRPPEVPVPARLTVTPGPAS